MAEEKKPEEKKEEKPAPKDNLVVTKHKVRIGGREIKYTVTAGTMILKEETADREKEAEGGRAQFLVYTKDGAGAKSKSTRFHSTVEGSSSVWLHLGVGPRRVFNR
jgi:carboxypeptidase C (cathepsin A)